MSIVLCGLDIETTGLKQEDGHRIIEIAISVYRFDPSTFEAKLSGSYVQRVNPGRSIDPGAQAVHGISFEALAHEPRWEEVAPKVSKIMSACSVAVAHNGDGFDLPFIGNELLRVGVAVPDIRTVDTMLQARWATPMGKYPKLSELAFACGVSYDKSKAHAALYDVQVMMECFFKGFRLGFYTIPHEVCLGETS